MEEEEEEEGRDLYVQRGGKADMAHGEMGKAHPCRGRLRARG